jgi:hypothetical protein
MTRDRLNELKAANEADLEIARRLRHSGWVATLTGRRESLREIEARVAKADESGREEVRRLGA